MNSRFSSVLTAVIALSLSAGFVAPTHAAPMSVGRQQYKLAEGNGGKYRGPQLNLSDEQKNQMKQIRQQAKQQIYNSVYTDVQRQAVDAWRQQHPRKNSGQQSRLGS